MPAEMASASARIGCPRLARREFHRQRQGEVKVAADKLHSTCIHTGKTQRGLDTHRYTAAMISLQRDKRIVNRSPLADGCLLGILGVIERNFQDQIVHSATR